MPGRAAMFGAAPPMAGGINSAWYFKGIGENIMKSKFTKLLALAFLLAMLMSLLFSMVAFAGTMVWSG